MDQNNPSPLPMPEAGRMRFTPGPWKYRPARHDDWGWVRGSDGWLVARASRKITSSEEINCRSAGTDPYEDNARLIAAAPDLYAACERALFYLQHPEHLGEQDAIYALSAALSAARGDKEKP